MTMFYVNYEGDVFAMQNYPFYDKALALTKELVAIPSQSNSPHGERDIALHIADWMGKIPYFQEHPDQLIVRPLKNNDPCGRLNVLAIAFGRRSDSRQTIILHGHIDTVQVDDYDSINMIWSKE